MYNFFLTSLIFHVNAVVYLRCDMQHLLQQMCVRNLACFLVNFRLVQIQFWNSLWLLKLVQVQFWNELQFYLNAKKKCFNERFQCVNFKASVFMFLSPHCITLPPSCESYFGDIKAVLPQNEKGKASQGSILICRGVTSI